MMQIGWDIVVIVAGTLTASSFWIAWQRIKKLTPRQRYLYSRLFVLDREVNMGGKGIAETFNGLTPTLESVAGIPDSLGVGQQNAIVQQQMQQGVPPFVQQMLSGLGLVDRSADWPAGARERRIAVCVECGTSCPVENSFPSVYCLCTQCDNKQKNRLGLTPLEPKDDLLEMAKPEKRRIRLLP